MFVRGDAIWLQFGAAVLGVLSSAMVSGVAQTTPEMSDLSVPNVRAALAREPALIAAHPQDPMNYVNLAYTLTDAGAGEQARAAASEATRVAPTSSFAFNAQGWVLHHNSIGVDYGSGFDYDGAVRSYQRAIELDPGDLDLRQSFANLLEFNRDGVRYAPDAQLALAIDAYRYVKQHQQVPETDVLSNLAIDLFYAGRYDEAIQELSGLPATTEHLGVLLASIAASEGSAAAVSASGGIQGDEQRRKDALNFAAEGLWDKRLYAQAADLLTASLPDTARGTAAKIQLFRNLKPYTAADLPASDPCRPVQRLLELAFKGPLQQGALQELLSRHSYATDAAWRQAVQGSGDVTPNLPALMKKTGLPRAVVADIVLGSMRLTAPATPGPGAPVRVQFAGLAPMQFFVVLEDDVWKIAASGGSASEAGTQALYLLDSGSAAVARSLLQWYYSQREHATQTGDALSGDLFARFWAPDSREAPEATLFGAAALTSDPGLLRPLVPRLVKAREKAHGRDQQTELDLLLTHTYLQLQDAADSDAIATSLLKEYPGSDTALHLAGQAFELEHNWAAWKALLAKRAKTDPDDRELLLEEAREAEAEGDFARARQAYQHILDGAHVASEDYAMYAWLSLFEGNPDDKALAAAQQAASNPNNRSYLSLLTVAYVDAARGSTAEAHQELLDAMSSVELAEPDGAVWYGFGRIYEQYGVIDAAIAAYQRTIERADSGLLRGVLADGLSPSALARLRLRALTAQADHP